MTVLVPTREMAKLVGLAPETLRRWAKEGKIPRIMPSTRLSLFDPDEVIEALKEMETASA